MKVKCCICGQEEVKHPKSQLCGPCYGWLYYWQKKTPTEWINYLRRGARREDRVRLLAPHPVLTLRRRKA